MAKRRRRDWRKQQPKTLVQQSRPYNTFAFARKPLLSTLTLRLKGEPRNVILAVLGHPWAKELKIFETATPRSVEELSVAVPTGSTESIEKELSWTLAALLHHKRTVDAFLTARPIVERSILVGNYTGASEALEVFVSEFGTSWWSVEISLLVAQRLGGLEANRTKLKEYEKKLKSSWTKFVTSSLSQRVEDDMSADDVEALGTALKPISVDKQKEQRGRYYWQFKLDYRRFVEDRYLPYCLTVEESHSIVDRYRAFVRVLQRYAPTLLAAGSSPIADILVESATAFADQRLRVLASIRDATFIDTTPATARLLEALAAYTTGDYERSYQKSLEGVGGTPDAFEFVELLAKSAVRTGKSVESTHHADSPVSVAMAATYHVLSRDRDTSRSLRTLTKLAYQLDGLSYSDQIYAFVQQYSGQRYLANSDCSALTGASLATPRLSMLISSKDQAQAYLHRLAILFPGNAAVALFQRTRDSLAGEAGQESPTVVPATRSLKYGAYVHEQLGKHAEALERYKELESLAGENPLLKADAAAGQYRCHLKLKDYFECATILGSVAARTPSLATDEAIVAVLHQYDRHNDSKWRSNIAWCVLRDLHDKFVVREVSFERLHEVLDDFLTAWGVQKPSELRTVVDQLPATELIYVLRHVCIPDVLEWFIWYDTKAEMEAERSILCQWLIDIDPDNAPTYRSEIADLASRAAMRDLTQEVDRSRIHVDVEGVKSSLPESFSDRVVRCAQYAHLSQTLRDGITVVGVNQESIKNVMLEPEDQGFKLFRVLFADLRQIFLASTEYGLEANLSQRIRHGTLANEIRAQFESGKLVTQTVSDGSYAPNGHWLSQINVPTLATYQQTSAAFSDLSGEIDAIIAEVRDAWVQVRAGEKNKKGMFDFEFSEADIRPLYAGIVTVETVNEVVDRMIDCLWRRMELDLSKLRDAITGPLKGRFFAAVDLFLEKVQAASGGGEPAQLRDEVTACKTRVQHGLDSIAEWFRVDTSQRMRPYDLNVLLEAMLVQVGKFCRPSRLSVMKSTTGDVTLPGRTFRQMWDLFFILLDNIARHSKCDLAAVTLEISHAKRRLGIKVRNEIGGDVDRGRLADIIEKNKTRKLTGDDRELLLREGGTGLAKMRKIVSYDLKASEYILSLLLEESHFTVEIAINSEVLVDENTDNR